MIDVMAIRRIVEGLLSSLKTPSLRWAQVHTLSPLRIKFPGEAPLPYTPTLLVSADTLGATSRLLVAEWGGQGVVVGISGGQPVGAIGAGADLNTYITYGTWTQGNNSAAASGFNYPQPMAGMLEVVPHDAGAMVWQRYTTYRHTALVGTEPWGPRVYVRAFYAGTWSPWSSALDTSKRCSAWNTTNSGSLAANAYWRLSGLTGGSNPSNMLNATTGLITIPETTDYHIGATAHFSNSGVSARRALIIEKGSGAAGTGVELLRVELTASNRWTPTISVDMNLAANDVISAVVTSNVGYEIRGADFRGQVSCRKV